MTEVNTLKESRKENLKKNFNRFKQSKIGMTGLVIVILFGVLAILQPLLFLSGIWDYKTYDPVVGYDAEKYIAEVVVCLMSTQMKDMPKEECLEETKSL